MSRWTDAEWDAQADGATIAYYDAIEQRFKDSYTEAVLEYAFAVGNPAPTAEELAEAANIAFMEMPGR